MSKKRIIIELIIFIFLIIFSFLTRDIQSVILGISQFQFLVEIMGIYIFFRVLISLIIITLKYKSSGIFRDYKGESAKIYFENSVYLHLTIIFFIMIFFSSTLAVAFTLLFLVFGILWILSNLSTIGMKKTNVSQKNKNKNPDYLKMYGEDERDFYNFIWIDYYSDLGYDFFKILTDNTFGILNNYRNENSIVLLDKLSKSNYLFLVPRSLFFGDVNLLCGVFNSYLEKLEIKCRIRQEDILKKDNYQLRNRRRDNLDTFCNDLEIIDEILRKKNYRVISIGVNDSSDTFLCLSVISNSVYKKVISIKSKM